jgi:hypothetical protein
MRAKGLPDIGGVNDLPDFVVYVVLAVACIGGAALFEWLYKMIFAPVRMAMSTNIRQAGFRIVVKSRYPFPDGTEYEYKSSEGERIYARDDWADVSVPSRAQARQLRRHLVQVLPNVEGLSSPVVQQMLHEQGAVISAYGSNMEDK